MWQMEVSKERGLESNQAKVKTKKKEPVPFFFGSVNFPVNNNGFPSTVSLIPLNVTISAAANDVTIPITRNNAMGIFITMTPPLIQLNVSA